MRQYKISVADSVLEDLDYRLKTTIWPEQIEGSEWEYGANIKYVKELCDYWQRQYDWRKFEKQLNKYPQFVCTIDGVDIRFWHVKSEQNNAIPLLLLHGWPGSAYEFFDLIEPLSNPDCDSPAFDVVVPCLPGFGFSGKPKEAGWGVARVADAFHELMKNQLGYEKYAVQGGDWGAMIASKMGSIYANSLICIHINFPNIPIPVPQDEFDSLPDADKEMIITQSKFDMAEGAYHLVQETKPDSLTISQSNSPAGIAAWIVEKFRTWSDCDGDIEKVYSKDKLLTNIMFYWAGSSISSAARIYYESYQNPELHWGAPNPQITAKTAVAFFPKDLFNRPKGWVEKHYNLVRWTNMPSGGHFAALEKPELLIKDIRETFIEL